MRFINSFLIVFIFSLGINIYAQTYEDNYRLSLPEVAKEFELRFNKKLILAKSWMKDKEVDFALWRFRSDAEVTLRNLLGPLDLAFEKDGDDTYRIIPFGYHRRTPEEGAELLEDLAKLYDNKEEWEERKNELRSCFLKALDLEKLPSWDASKAIITKKRKYKNYTVENVALETLPGVYVFGSVYKPLKANGKMPIIVSPNGHFGNGRYNKDIQARCAVLAQMGAIVMNYDLFAWGESVLQFESTKHRTSLAMVVQTINGFRVLDYLLTQKNVDSSRIGITGGSGGGSQTMLLSALDSRYTVSVPVVMLSSYFSGGCPCESGRPVHLCGGGTTNVEMTSMFAPKPQLIISDGGDWSNTVPEVEYPFVKRIYGFYTDNKNVIQNAHFADEGHDYGSSKRFAMYDFMREYLSLKSLKKSDGTWDESGFVEESIQQMQVFGDNPDLLPENAVKSFEELEKLWNSFLDE